MYDPICKKVEHIKLQTVSFRDTGIAGETITQCHGLPLDGSKGITIREGL